MHAPKITLKLMAQVNLIFVLAAVYSSAVIAVPIAPDIKNTQISSQANFSSTDNLYTYQYNISSSGVNNEIIFGFRVDITTDGGQSTTMSDPLPQVPDYKISTLKYLSKNGVRILPVELIPPTGWSGLNISTKGTATFMASAETAISPGEQLDGFKITSASVPGIRKVHVVPGGIRRWFSLVNAEDETEEAQKIADEVKESFNFYSYALGPVRVTPGSYSHWNQFRNDLNTSIGLGWIQDTTLGEILTGQLSSAREALDAEDGTLAKSRLQVLIDQVNNSADSQRKVEARDLVVLNTQALINSTADTPIPFEPKLIVTPKVTELPIGLLHTVTAKIVNVAYNDEPVPGVFLRLTVVEGPNQGLIRGARTDANGEAVFSYIGNEVGTDKIIIKEPPPILGDTKGSEIYSNIGIEGGDLKIVVKELTQGPT